MQSILKMSADQIQVGKNRRKIADTIRCDLSAFIVISWRLRDKYKKYGRKTREAKLAVVEINIVWQQAR
jgi:hypothetical protein